MARDQKTLTYRVRRLPPDIDEAGLVRILETNLTAEGCALTIRVFSLARSLDAPDATRSKDATVLFTPLPQQLKDRAQCSFSTTCNGFERSIIVDRDFLDFTVLNEVNDDEHTLDCVAISGLASHPFGSWQQRGNGQSFMWLRDGLPKDLPGTRTISYGYDTHLNESKSFKTIYDIAITLVNRLTVVGFGWPSSKPIVLIAHSLGGIILKEALGVLALSSGQEPSIIGKLRGLLLFDVPNGGMQTASLITMVKGDPTEELITDLSPKSKYLSHIDSYFNGLQYIRQFPVISFYETKTTKTVQQSAGGEWSRCGPEVIMVERDSAVQKCSHTLQEAQPIDEDHSAMVKFAVGDVNYTRVLHCFQEILDRKPSVSNAGPTKNLNSARRMEDSGAEDRFIPGERNTLRVNEPKKCSIDDILKSLCLEAFDYRMNSISPQYQSTFEWIFNDDSLEFVSWLLKGDGAYWIEGKPGAGKSTLMRFIYENRKTMELLEHWSQSSPLIKARFFFHHRGSAPEKSFEGLLRSILHQILKQLPELVRYIPKTCLPVSEKDQTNWSLSNLRRAINSIYKQRQEKLGICLFIDALDEFDGHLELIAEFMKCLLRPDTGSGIRCKICFSARPRQIIQDSLGQHMNIRIQEHTKKDIQMYTEGRLTESPQIVTNLTSSEEMRGKATQIVEVILKKAASVFLWVRLALDEMVKVLAENESSSTKDLETLLDRLPLELDHFYSTIVSRIPQDFRWEVYITLEIILRAVATPSVQDVLTIINCSSCKTATASRDKRRLPHGEKSISIFIQRLKDGCGGLIEIVEMHGKFVQLMHETVRVFVSRPDFRHLMLGHRSLFRPQNGYTELAKIFFTNHLNFDELESQTPRCLFNGNFREMTLCMRYYSMAEATTGTSQYEMIDELTIPFTPTRQKNETLKEKSFYGICDTGLSFAIVSNLLLYVQRRFSSSSNTSSEILGKGLLSHLSIATILFFEILERNPEAQTFDYRSMSQLLLDNGVDTREPYNGLTPFQWLYYHCPHNPRERYLRFCPIVKSAIDLAQLFLQNGQDPDCDIPKDGSNSGHKKCCTPLHVSSAFLIQSLFESGAEINRRDYRNRTPLDYKIVEISERHATILNMAWVQGNKSAVDVLIQNGGLISRTGLVNLQLYMSVLKDFGIDTQDLRSLPCLSKERGFLSLLDFPMEWSEGAYRRYFRHLSYKISFHMGAS